MKLLYRHIDFLVAKFGMAAGLVLMLEIILIAELLVWVGVI